MLPNLNLFQYKICRELPLPPLAAGPGYKYVLAGNGVFLQAENRFVSVLGQIGFAEVRGLPDLTPEISIKHGRIPAWMLLEAAADMGRFQHEVMYIATLDGDQAKITRLPDPEATPSGVEYRSELYPKAILDLHSHGRMKAFYSPTDDQDERGFRWYGVIGRVYTKPEMRLRLGVHGYHFEMPVSTLFEETAAVRDAWLYPDVKLPRPTKAAIEELEGNYDELKN